MNLPRGKRRIAGLSILCANVSALLGVTMFSAPQASSRAAGAHRLVLSPPRPRWTPFGAPPKSRPSLAPRSATESVASAPAATSGVWTPLNSQPSSQAIDFFPGSAFLLTDGRVLVHDDNITSANDWWTLTPDNTGSYVNGTWTQVASPPDCPNGFPGAAADT